MRSNRLRKKVCVPDGSHESSMVDLTIDSDDDGNGDDEGSMRPSQRMTRQSDGTNPITSDDGFFESFPTPLLASIGVIKRSSVEVKELKVMVKWGIFRKEETPIAEDPLVRLEELWSGRVASLKSFEQRRGEKSAHATEGKVAVGAPRVGMGVQVKFDDGILYCGKISEVKIKRKGQLSGQTPYHIQIQYDDGEIEYTTYPDPDISLVPNVSCHRLNDDEMTSAPVNTKARSKSFIPPVKDVVAINETSSKGSAKKGTIRDVRPDAVESNKNCSLVFDEDDYDVLRQRYLTKRIREKAELAGGITLRRQTKGRYIDQQTPGFRMLKSRVEALLRKNDHAEVYSLLCQLRDWDVNPQRVPVAFRDANVEDGSVVEVLDLTREGDESGKFCIDVDEFITDVLLEGTKKTAGQKISPLHTLSTDYKETAPNQNDSIQGGGVREQQDCNEERNHGSEAENEESNKRNNVPDVVTSKSCTSAYDKDDYEMLHKKYLQVRICEKVELASGMTLRRKAIGRVIDQKTSGFRLLKCRADALLRNNQHSEVYGLLSQLRDWEGDHQKGSVAFQDAKRSHAGTVEMLDLTKEDNRSQKCFIDEVLLAKRDAQKDFPLLTPHNSSAETVDAVQEDSPLLRHQKALPSDDVWKETGNNSTSIYQHSNRGQILIAKPEVQIQFKLTLGGIEKLRSFFYTMIKQCIIRSTEKNSTDNSVNLNSSLAFNDEADDALTTSKVNDSSNDVSVAVTGAAPNPEFSVSKQIGEKSSQKFKRPGQRVIEKRGHCYTQNKPRAKTRRKSDKVAPSKYNKSGIRLDCPEPSSHMQWNAIPKPPGQRTIPDCYEFHVAKKSNMQPSNRVNICLESRLESAGKNTVGLQDFTSARDFGFCGKDSIDMISMDSAVQSDGTPKPNECEGFYVTASSNRPENAQNSAECLCRSSSFHHESCHQGFFQRKAPNATSFHCPGTLLFEADGINQSFNHAITKKEDDFLSAVALLQSIKEPTCQTKEERNSCVITSVPRTKCMELMTHPGYLLPKAEEGTHEAFMFAPPPSTPTVDKKRPVSNIITPEARILAKPKKKKTRGVKKARKKSHLDSSGSAGQWTETHRFSIADFGLLFKRETILHWRDPVRKNSSVRQRRLRCLQTSITTPNFSIIPPSRLTSKGDKSNSHWRLHEDWKKQVQRRSKGQWLPSGHLNGRWKPPKWAVTVKEETSCLTHHLEEKKYLSCRKSLLPKLGSLISMFLSSMGINRGVDGKTGPMQSVRDVVCPHYFEPTPHLLKEAHLALVNLLPRGDCEDWEVVKVARRYYDHWRPKDTKIILLAESHAFTPKDRLLHGPGLDDNMLQGTYFGPREFISLVYCLGYGENGALKGQAGDKTNRGTCQFWTLFAACSRGVEHVATTSSKNSFSSPFAADLLKGGKLSVEERLKAKLNVLQDLRKRGIWLLDASIFGWYMSQPQEYSRSSISQEVHRRSKKRPPRELKVPSLVLSWELFTKHLIRSVADEGNLKLLIPIGMEVEGALSRERLEDAVRGSSDTRVTETFPAPNAWIPGGYGPFHVKLASMVNEAAPKVQVKAAGAEV